VGRGRKEKERLEFERESRKVGQPKALRKPTNLELRQEKKEVGEKAVIRTGENWEKGEKKKGETLKWEKENTREDLFYSYKCTHLVIQGKMDPQIEFSTKPNATGGWDLFLSSMRRGKKKRPKLAC